MRKSTCHSAIKVSIVVPVYNVEQYLRRCLDSLANQILDEIEIIVVNDGSVDNSQFIIDEYILKYPYKIRAFYKMNGGLSAARNYGIEQANGAFIGFVDSDDWVDLGFFKDLYDGIIKEDAEIACCDFKTIFPFGTSIQKARQGVNPFLIPATVCNKIFKKELFSEFKFRVGITHEDAEIMPKLLYVSRKTIFIETKHYYYYWKQNPNSITTNNVQYGKDYEVVLASLKQFATEKNCQLLWACYYFHLVDLLILNIKIPIDQAYLSYLQHKVNIRKYSRSIYLKRFRLFYVLEQLTLGLLSKPLLNFAREFRRKDAVIRQRD